MYLLTMSSNFTQSPNLPIDSNGKRSLCSTPGSNDPCRAESHQSSSPETDGTKVYPDVQPSLGPEHAMASQSCDADSVPQFVHTESDVSVSTAYLSQLYSVTFSQSHLKRYSETSQNSSRRLKSIQLPVVGSGKYGNVLIERIGN
jgi:hypothetical protein